MSRMPDIRSIVVSIIFLSFAWAPPSASGFLLPAREGPVGDKHSPVVEAITAQKEIGEGSLWKIYVRASDPDGDLDKIHVTFSQPGGGSYSPDLLIQKEMTNKLNGFILIWARLQGGGATGDIYGDVDIRVEDRAGNMSQPKTLEFTLRQFGKEDRYVPPSRFNATNSLGQADFPLQTETDIGKS